MQPTARVLPLLQVFEDGDRDGQERDELAKAARLGRDRSEHCIEDAVHGAAWCTPRAAPAASGTD
jgi:hypothetical protein